MRKLVLFLILLFVLGCIYSYINASFFHPIDFENTPEIERAQRYVEYLNATGQLNSYRRK